ncbi:hypothetical protein HY408_01045 [Candidatus Gottesmanbacteria bacterium]|nr:hypothetical protein [Candidatus Gottesmanbacteria bacterium]
MPSSTAQTAPQTVPPPATQPAGTSDKKTLITILLLIFFFPVGLLLMWFGTNWKLWVKLVVSGVLFFVTFFSLIIFIMGLAVVSSVNPGRQFTAARDTQRRADLNAISSAVYQYATEANGEFPPGIPTTSTRIGTKPGFVDLTPYLVPTYLREIPKDPASGTNEDTRYSIYKNSSGELVLSAESELTPGASITVNR